MRIAIIAYGSLIWDEECLAPHIHGGWRRGFGPRLPVEFCRVSPKRKRALVLTIDPEQGHEVATSFTTSRRRELSQAVADLARRERCDERYIGVCRRDDPAPGGEDAVTAAVRRWLNAQQDFDAAIWAALPVNFLQETGNRFGFAAALEHLRALPRDALAEAWRYITFAPAETRTPLRRFLNRHPWWRGLGRELIGCADAGGVFARYR